MAFLERVQMAIAMLRGVSPIDLPASGRSSEETTLGGAMTSFLKGFGSINPVIDFEMLRTLKCLWLYNPDFSQYVANIVNLGNPGHSLSVDAATDAKAEQAVTRLNEAASRIYPQGCGVDGLLDQYLTSIAWSGAISSEDVVDIAGRGVRKVVMVPVEQIRFKYNPETDAYEPWQRASGAALTRANPDGLIPLNPETYHYVPMLSVENSPYAKPPATAAVEAILDGQKPIMENLRWIAKKFGILGLVSIGVAPIRHRGGETDDEYTKRFEKHLASYAERLDGKFNRGLIVLPKPNTIDTTSVAAGGQGLAEVNTISEQQVFSGLGAQPGFHGRTDSTTETFADVVYYLLTAQTAKMQRVAKRRMEQTYRLDLRLAGIDVVGVSLQFDKAHSRNALQEAQTDQTKFADILARVRAGAITPDEGAQALGLDQWADPELLFSQTGVAPPAANSGQLSVISGQRKTLRMKFDKASQQYRFQPDRFEIWSGSAEGIGTGGSVIPFIKKKATQA